MTEVTSGNDLSRYSTQVCKKCSMPITEGHAYELGDDRWHTHCFICSKCDKLLGCNSNFLVLGTGALVCSECSYACKSCGKKIDDLAILTGDHAYCSSCFRCRSCRKRIEDLRYARTSKGLFCIPCHQKLLEMKKERQLQRRAEKSAENLVNSSLSSTPVIEKDLPSLPMPFKQSLDLSPSSTSSSYQVPPSEGGQSRLDDGLEPPAEVERAGVYTSGMISDSGTTAQVLPVDRQIGEDFHLQPVPERRRPSVSIEEINAQLSPNKREGFMAMSPARVKNRSYRVMENDLGMQMGFDEGDTTPSLQTPSKRNISVEETTDSLKGLNIGFPENDLESTEEKKHRIEKKNTDQASLDKTFRFGHTENASSPKSLKGISDSLSRSFSVKSPGKGLLSFHRHKRSGSGSVDHGSNPPSAARSENEGRIKHRYQRSDTSISPMAAAYKTPPLPSPGYRGDLGHVENGESNALKSGSLELRSLKNEITSLNASKTSINSEITQLHQERHSLAQEVKTLAQQLEALKAEIDDKTLILADLESNISMIPETENSQSQSTDSIPLSSSPERKKPSGESEPADDFSDARSRQKARFWRKPKISKKMFNGDVPGNSKLTSSTSSSSIPSAMHGSSPIVTILEPDNRDATDGPSKFAMIKSRSSNFLSLRAQENNNSDMGRYPERRQHGLYGVPLQATADAEGRRVPFLVSRCIEEVETRGVDSEGIYRLSGGSSNVEEIEDAFVTFKTTNEANELGSVVSSADINGVAGVLKRYLIKLPNPIVTYECYDRYIAIEKTSANSLEQLASVLRDLPPAHQATLCALLKHLQKIIEKGSLNRMTANNLSVVFAPTLARARQPERELLDMGSRTTVTEMMLTNAGFIVQSLDT